ncbi:hypothetical protein LSCM1_06731 [Leishmania martiniquensis]|uniref:Uncharacterized protein n=1 Tax=Leishmania martiniquensis TaxID=1580590 RepID=A0A836KSG3_9TRYP|nr:hypothetical protein LSCM1_06731 [Leishmania martiniquensis]
MRRTDLTSTPQSTEGSGAAARSDDAVATVFPEDPVAPPSSSVLYTLLQDLGLTATAQALREELLRQQSRVALPSPPSLPSQASEIFVALSHENGAASPNSLAALLSPPRSADVSPPQGKTADPASSSVEPLPGSVQSSLAAGAPQRDVRMSSGTIPAGDIAAELQRKLQSYCHLSQCAKVITGLAASAVEPLLAMSPASTAATTTPLQLVETLTDIWHSERRAALPHRATAGKADAALAAGVHSHRARDFEVAALIARAAWCELRITELVFMQEVHLAHSSTAATAHSVATKPLNEAQCELVDVAGQLVTALQELRTTCGAAAARRRGVSAPPQDASGTSSIPAGVVIASSIVSRLHSKSVGWLRNAECIMAWVLRRQGAFDISAEAAQASSCAQQQRKRRCLEASTTSTFTEGPPDPVCCCAASPLLKPLQDVILGLPTDTSAPAPSYQQCLEAEIARSAAATVKSEAASLIESAPVAVARDECALFSSVRIPITVRVAMTVQRVKLLLTLIGALLYNGEGSILCVLEDVAADSIRSWWMRQSAMSAQFLVQCAHQLNSILTPSLAHSSAAAQASPPSRHQALSAASEAAVHSLREELEALAKEVLLCACPLACIAPPVRQDSRLDLLVRLINALQQAHDARAAHLDRYVLQSCTTAAANIAISVSSPLSAAADVFSPLSSVSSPTLGSEGSPITSPEWTVRVPSPFGLDLRGATGHPTPPEQAPQSSIGSDTSSISDSLEAARTAAQVLQWKPHFTQLLATIATGRWQAQHYAPQAPYPGSRYHRLRLRMRDALRHAQELLRLQPRLQVGARGVVYPPHPALGSDPDPGVSLSLVEQMPCVLQLATLQDARVLQRRVGRRLAREARSDEVHAAPAENSASNGGGGDTAPALAASLTDRRAASPPSVSQARTAGWSNTTSTSGYRSATSMLAAATATALGRPPTATATDGPTASHRAASGNEGRVATATSTSARPPEGQRSASPHGEADAGERRANALMAPSSEPATGTAELESSPPQPAPSEAVSSRSSTSHADAETDSSAFGVAAAAVAVSPEPQWGSDGEGQDEDEDAADDPQLERWHLHGDEAQEELEEADEEAAAIVDDDDGIDWAQSDGQEEEDDEEGAEEVGSQASSADMDYERAEDEMKEEVECVEATPDGRLLALLTARGRLMVLRMQAHDSTWHYEEEVLIDTSLPNMPSREKRLQWYESLSSFVHFSPCRRFLLAAVQFAAVELKPNSTCAMARAANGGTGQLNVYSLHRDGDDGEEAACKSRGDLEQEDDSSASAAIGGARERLRRLVGLTTDRLYGTFCPHDGPCLSARWVDTRWWGGGRRSRWANSAVEPLNSTNAAATVLLQSMKAGDLAGKSTTTTALSAKDSVAHRMMPESWRAAAGVLLSEYQCISLGMDDLILRWLPACGVVLQRILTEPAQDIIVSPLMAAFYVASDNGDLYMYDAWDERSMTDGHPCGSGEDADPCDMYSKSPSTTQAHRLVLPVTEEGHPRFHRVGRMQHQHQYDYSTAASTRSPQSQQQQERSLRRDTLDDPDTADQVQSNRSSAHYTGPVTPVFQRFVDPSRGMSGSQSHTPFYPHHPYYYDSGAAVQGGFSDNDEDYEEGHEVAQSRLGGKPAEESTRQKSSGQAKAGADSVGWTALPRHLRWLLPHQWAAHTPWDAQLGRRLIRHLLCHTRAATPADIGELFYERDEETAAVGAASAVEADEGDQPSLMDERENLYDARGRHRARLHGASGGAAVSVHDEEGTTYGTSGSRQDVSSEDEHGSCDSAEREYAYTNGADYDDDDDGARRPLPSRVMNGGGRSHISSEAAAAAAAATKGVPVPVLECAAHPTPARGPLQRAYYPSGACLVYRSVARALCSAGDLTDRQTQSEMGPGGATHHLLSMAFSGEPQWRAGQRLWSREAEEAGAPQAWQRLSPQRSAAVDHGDARDGTQLQQGDGDTSADSIAGPSAPLTLWSTAALARVLLWKDYFSTSRHLAGAKAEAWAEWESEVLATTYHADVLPRWYTRHAGSSTEPRWSATELLAVRGYLGPRDAWRRCAPASQRGLAATARNGRYLCIMASVGPYRKLVNPREPLRDMPGFYASVVFDVYAGAVLRVIPVCPTELNGLRGQCMWTSERHESDPKAPIYRLPCTVTVVPLPPASAATATAGKVASLSSPTRARADSNESPTRLLFDRGLPSAALCDEGVVDDEEDGEPTEVVTLTVGGLGNCIYVFDALSGRRLVHEAETARHCGESAAAAYEASTLSDKARSKARGARSAGVRRDSAAVLPSVAAARPGAPSSLPLTAASPALPASIRKPADVLVSVTTWGRGTGFDGITDRPSTTSSPCPSWMRETGTGESSSVTAQPSHLTTSETQAAAAAEALAMSEAVARSGAPAPWLLQRAAPSELCGWHLRGILWWVHEHPQPSTLYGSDAGSAVTEREARWSAESVLAGGAGARVSGGRVKGNGTTRAASGRGQGAVNRAVTPSLSPAFTTLAANAAFTFFYQTLLGVAGGTAPTTVSEESHSRRQHTAESSTAALGAAAAGSPHRTTGVGYPSYGFVWRQRRCRLLQRLLRHYDVGMLWQAYVALFCASTTAAGSLAPQSAVCALVQWALSTDKAATAAAAFLGPSIGHTRWIWCRTPSPPEGRKGASAPSKQLHLSGGRVRRATARSHDVEHDDVGRGGAKAGLQARSTVPFACVLQQREEFVAELQALDMQQQQQQATGSITATSLARSMASVQAKSLLASVRAQAMVEGMLPLNAKGRGAQQQRSVAAAATHESASSAVVKLPPSHHQNQLHVDVVNCVATWLDANGGFYVCCGCEDGGLYIMGGCVTD